jgi:cytochrome c biogenesis protein CcmG/thiol:disulfide interchange protein DsbE
MAAVRHGAGARMPENRGMRPTAAELLVFLAVAAVVVAIGAALLRMARVRWLGWLVLCAGLAAVAALALAEFTGRLGPENLWFRAPTFYGAMVILLGAAFWWLRRPAPRALRFGLPALLGGLLGVGALLARSDGRSMPLAMLMPSMGTPAPELSYFDSSGAKRELSELRGRVVLLNFWATWCAPCRREMPMLSELQREHADDGLVVLYVSLEEPEILAPFLAANRFDGIQGRLDHAASFYDAGKFYPLSYLISRDGRVRQRWSGRPTEDWLAAQVRGEL